MKPSLEKRPGFPRAHSPYAEVPRLQTEATHNRTCLCSEMSVTFKQHDKPHDRLDHGTLASGISPQTKLRVSALWCPAATPHPCLFSLAGSVVSRDQIGQRFQNQRHEGFDLESSPFSAPGGEDLDFAHPTSAAGGFSPGPK